MSRLEDYFVVQLGLLIERSSHMQYSVGRILRGGLSEMDIPSGMSTRECLLRDMDDLKASILSVERALSPVLGGLVSARAFAAATEPASRSK